MRTIVEENLLMRARTELPGGLKLATVEFREGWNFARTVNARQLEKKVITRGWNFIRIADGMQASGVGDTSQEAISNALRLALLRMNENFNAGEVKYIEVSRYPWFFLARVRVGQYLIQKDAFLPISDESMTSPTAHRQRRLPPDTQALYPDFGSATPQLKKMLIAFRSAQAFSL
jgi:hypothetical protein